MTARAEGTLQPRAHGEVRLAVRRRARTEIAALRQGGSLKLLFPRTDGCALQAVVINTAGGVTGGDRFRLEAHADPDTVLTLTTQAAERAYRVQPGETGRIRNSLILGAGARLNWLPQETILFQGCDLDRRLTVDLGPGASALIVEPLVFGRAAMGEHLAQARLRDRIEIRRAGRLTYLDAIALGPDVEAQLGRTAIGAGAGAVATLLYIVPDAEARLAAVRTMLPATAGASLVRDDTICARILAPDGFGLRATLLPLLALLSGEDLPRPWMI